MRSFIDGYLSYMNWKSELDLAKRAAAAASSFLIEAFEHEKLVLSEIGRDIKLQADRDAEALIVGILAESGYSVLAEEGGESGTLSDAEPVWIVDPLDGTMNFKHGIPFCCVSLALSIRGRPVLGVIDDFIRGERFTGIPGEGAWLNESPMRVSEARMPGNAILTTGFPTKFDVAGPAVQEFVSFARRFKKVRMLGSAALMMAYVACGRVDAYAEKDIMYWDVAAGAALIEAAGGWVDIRPTAKDKWARSVRCAANAALWDGA